MAQSFSKIKAKLTDGAIVLGSRVLVIPEEMPTEVKGGIILPPGMRDQAPATGIVYKIGMDLSEVVDGQETYITKIRPGDLVVFSIYSGVQIKFDPGTGEERTGLCLNEEDILMILEPEMSEPANA